MCPDDAKMAELLVRFVFLDLAPSCWATMGLMYVIVGLFAAAAWTGVKLSRGG